MDSDDEDDDWYVGVMSQLGFLYSWYFWYSGLLTWQWLTDQLRCPNHDHSQIILRTLLFFIFSLADSLNSTHCSKAATYLETFLWIQWTILVSCYCNNWNLPHIFDCVDFFEETYMCNYLHNKGLKQKCQEILVTSVSLLVTKLHFSLGHATKILLFEIWWCKNYIFYFLFLNWYYFSLITLQFSKHAKLISAKTCSGCFWAATFGSGCVAPKK